MLLRSFFAIVAVAATGVALVGVVLPGLPTVPFLLVAAACGRRGWPGLASRLEAHPRWSAVLRDWRRDRVVPRRAKWLAAGMMTASWTVLALSGQPAVVLAPLGGLFLVVMAWLGTRPEKGTPVISIETRSPGRCA